MNPMQTKLEQIYNDYLELKNYILKDSETVEKVKKEVQEEALTLETIEQQASLYFDRLGYKSILNLDLIEKKKELYYTYEAYKNLVEVDDKIKDELQDYKVNAVFAVVGGKKEIVSQELLNSYKNQSIEYSVQLDEYNKRLQGAI